jgi:predicted RNase H-like HicB family nuclease
MGRSLRVLIAPADDVPGQWVGHCLDLDIVSAGTSPEHALEMATEAVNECVADDVAHGRNPFDRSPAPPDPEREKRFREAMDHIFERHEGLLRRLGDS